MSEENQNKLPELTEEQKKIVELSSLIENISFFSNTTQFNATIFQGLKLMLDKLTAIEGKISLIENKLTTPNGNP